ncbi:hypothetical protein AYO44_14010 [Planctomycetaceae bacterium SCGC AG-212-F19]|nr:hypothetical protein AYO44_14010 [Planctomycetaceae bacterium SCGC AG-212-F19]
MDRREFFDPQELARAAGHMLGALDEAPVPARVDAPDIRLLRFGRRAMAATFEVILSYAVAEAMSLAEAGLDEIGRLEEQLTVFHDHSEVSRLNREAAHRPVVVEDRLFALFQRAAKLNSETEGAFDITTGALTTKAWGFYRRQGRVPTPEELAEARQRVGMQHVLLDSERRSVRYARPGLEINLGSIGKGYALDRAAALLRDHFGLNHALLHGGQSSVLAVGSEPGSNTGWHVGIRHPLQRDQRLAVVRVRDRGLATSGAIFQNLEYNGRKLGHILDPRTGWPVEGIASATAIAPTAAEADALSTAFFILGVERAREYCAGHPGTAAVLLPAGADARPVVIGLTRDEIEV